MATVNNELSGIVGALFRQVGVAVGTSVVVSRKITGLGIRGVTAVANLVKRSDGSAEFVIEHGLAKTGSKGKELKSPSLLRVAAIGEKKQAKAVGEAHVEIASN